MAAKKSTHVPNAIIKVHIESNQLISHMISFSNTSVKYTYYYYPTINISNYFTDNITLFNTFQKWNHFKIIVFPPSFNSLTRCNSYEQKFYCWLKWKRSGVLNMNYPNKMFSYTSFCINIPRNNSRLFFHTFDIS